MVRRTSCRVAALFPGRKPTLFLLALTVPPLFAQTTITYQSYNPADGQFDLTENIDYYLPDLMRFGPGPYPVFVYVPGTFETYNDSLALLFVNGMQTRGYLAATVEYNNNESNQTCNLAYQPRAQGIFDMTRASSAIAELCALPAASCSKGIGVSGISQGAELSFLSGSYGAPVTAVMSLSGGDYFDNAQYPLPCEDKTETKSTFPIRLFNGASDPFFGGPSQEQGVTGISCASGVQYCWDPAGTGAGWFTVDAADNVKGFTGHCWMRDPLGPNPSPSACTGPFDPLWAPPATNTWSLDPNLDWLRTAARQVALPQ